MVAVVLTVPAPDGGVAVKTNVTLLVAGKSTCAVKFVPGPSAVGPVPDRQLPPPAVEHVQLLLINEEGKLIENVALTTLTLVLLLVTTIVHWTGVPGL